MRQIGENNLKRIPRILLIYNGVIVTAEFISKDSEEGLLGSTFCPT
jgi:hypothetical protein